MEEYLRSFNILTEREITLAVDAGSYRTVKKNEYFIREGQVCRQVAFVRSGIFRSFYHNTQGDEITYCFTFGRHLCHSIFFLYYPARKLSKISAR